MRILLVHDYGTPTGGAELQTIALRAGLRARGHDARLFTSSARPLPLEIAADVTTFGTQDPWVRRLTQALNPVAARDLARTIRDYRPDLVHVRMFLTQLSPLILPALRDVPAILHVATWQLICPLNTRVLPDGRHCPHRPGAICRREGCVSPAGRARFAIQSTLWRRWRGVFDATVAASGFVRERMEANGVPITHTIWNGVPDRGVRNALADRPTLSFAGRLFEKKGVDLLLDAFRLVRQRVPDAELLIAGEGPLRPALDARATALGLSGSARFLGHLPVAALDDVLGGAWAHVLPGRWQEPFGNSAAEALMRGTAVVSTNAGGPAELIQDGATGLLVPPGDVNALAKSLVSILTDRALATRMGLAAREFALHELTDQAMLDRIEALYADVVSRLQ